MRVILPEGELPVFWDINRCPVPVDFDARRVGPCIERVLRKLGHSDPISITAVGILSKVPKEILEAISSPLQYFPLYRRNVAKMNGEHVILPFPVLWYNLPLEGVYLSFHLSHSCCCSQVHAELDQVDDLDDNFLEEVIKHPSQVHWWFGDKTMMSEEEAIIAESALRILQSEFPHLFPKEDQVDDLDDNPEEVLNDPSLEPCLFGDKTILSEEEATIAKEALRIFRIGL